MEERKYGLRKRKSAERGGAQMEELLQLVSGSSKVLAFTGSGLSANSGMSMFSTKNGLYERARKRFKIQDGMKLFTYSFYKQRKTDVQAFFAQIYSEAQSSQAAPGHYALAELHDLRKLQRHYTMNIDGLAEVVGMDTWHWEFNPRGITVEMHGNIRDMVCPSCHAVEPLSRTHINQMKAKKAIMCQNCHACEMRYKIMLYADEEGECITPEEVWQQLEADLGQADLLLWVGISFEQSASVEYFKRVRQCLAGCGRLGLVKQVVINPSEDALFNLMSACSNTCDLQLVEVRASSDEALPALVERLRALGKAPAAAAAAAAKPVAVQASISPDAVKPPQQQQPAAAAARVKPAAKRVPIVPDACQPAVQQEPVHCRLPASTAVPSLFVRPSRPAQPQQHRPHVQPAAAAEAAAGLRSSGGSYSHSGSHSCQGPQLPEVLPLQLPPAAAGAADAATCQWQVQHAAVVVAGEQQQQQLAGVQQLQQFH